MSFILLHLLDVSNSGPLLQGRELRVEYHLDIDVQDSLESFWGVADLGGSESGDPRACWDNGQEVASDESNSPNKMVTEVA